MSVREIHVSDLLNRKVFDADGQLIGRIEELHVEVDERDGGAYVVREFHVGAIALLEALAGDVFLRAVARLLAHRGYKRFVIPWDVMDLTDPDHPRTRLSRKELAPEA